MAIQDAFSLQTALDSQSYAYKCWRNYYDYGNTMNISAEAIGKITQQWKGELDNWRAIATRDENAYDINDDDYAAAVERGKQNAKDKTGYNGGKSNMIARGVVDGVAGAAGVALVTPQIGKTVAKAGKALVKGVKSLFTKKTAEKVQEKVAEKTGEKTASKKVSASMYIAAAIAIATAASYQIKKPNKVQKQACDELQPQMTDADMQLEEAQGTMEDADEAVLELSEEW